MKEKSLEGQIVLTRYYSFGEFKDRIRDGKLKLKAQFELIELRDTTKFEYYVKRFQLDPEAERRLVESKRPDLYRIYFPLRRLCPSAEKLLTRYPRALSIYAKYHRLREDAQMDMVRSRKAKNTLKYATKRILCDKVREFFNAHYEDKKVLDMCEQIYLRKVTG